MPVPSISSLDSYEFLDLMGVVYRSAVPFPGFPTNINGVAAVAQRIGTLIVVSGIAGAVTAAVGAGFVAGDVARATIFSDGAATIYGNGVVLLMERCSLVSLRYHLLFVAVSFLVLLLSY